MLEAQAAPVEDPVDRESAPAKKRVAPVNQEQHAGALIINADDWGRDRETTDSIFDCAARGALSSVSAMVFMEDSQRAAAKARESGIDAGLHLNLTTPFWATHTPAKLREQQRRLAAYLLGNSLARAIFHPGLTGAFRCVVEAQLEEYSRLYGTSPRRVDGHHHMHLSANVLLQHLLPEGIIVRRHFSFEPGEKRLRHGIFRKFTSLLLDKRLRSTDFFFSLPPLEPPGRLEKIFGLAHDRTVEVETHPVNAKEYEFLTGGALFRIAGDVPIAKGYAVSRH
jgi:predicted glycoside hydrolase/deacetylase ChbG (UPF0249 family)